MNRHAALRWYVALPVSTAGGLVLGLATPQPGWWPAMFAGVMLVLCGLWRQGSGLGALGGALAGAGYWLPSISWLTLYLGPVPWLGLSAVMILWYALFGWGVSLATRGIPAWGERWLAGMSVRVRVVLLVTAESLAVAGLWVLREQLQGFWPYGGFAWGRLAHTQAEGPLAALVSWLGFSGFSALLVCACALPVAAAFSAVGEGSRGVTEPSRFGALLGRGTAVARGGLVAGGVVVALGLLAFVPTAELSETGTLRVAAIQGNSKSGIFDNRENGDVFRAHLEETERLISELDERGESVDVIVWPENSGEFALPEQVYRVRALERIAEHAGAPIVVGTILRDDDGVYTNSTLVVDADGLTEARYDKRRPVPFAEYMPHRPFYRSLAPELVDLVQLEYAHGTRSAVVPITGAAGTFEAALAICFDIIFDDHAVAMMADGGQAEVIFAQTNNADFGRTAESAQQLQIARLRAVETGRALVNISTVGTSAIVLPDGSDAASLPTHVAASMVADVPLVTGVTPALRWGAAIAAVWLMFGVAGVALGVFRRAARGARPDAPE